MFHEELQDNKDVVAKDAFEYSMYSQMEHTIHSYLWYI